MGVRARVVADRSGWFCGWWLAILLVSCRLFFVGLGWRARVAAGVCWPAGAWRTAVDGRVRCFALCAGRGRRRRCAGVRRLDVRGVGVLRHRVVAMSWCVWPAGLRACLSAGCVEGGRRRCEKRRRSGQGARDGAGRVDCCVHRRAVSSSLSVLRGRRESTPGVVGREEAVRGPFRRAACAFGGGSSGVGRVLVGARWLAVSGACSWALGASGRGWGGSGAGLWRLVCSRPVSGVCCWVVSRVGVAVVSGAVLLMLRVGVE